MSFLAHYISSPSSSFTVPSKLQLRPQNGRREARKAGNLSLDMIYKVDVNQALDGGRCRYCSYLKFAAYLFFCSSAFLPFCVFVLVDPIFAHSHPSSRTDSSSLQGTAKCSRCSIHEPIAKSQPSNLKPQTSNLKPPTVNRQKAQRVQSTRCRAQSGQGALGTVRAAQSAPCVGVLCTLSAVFVLSLSAAFAHVLNALSSPTTF